MRISGSSFLGPLFCARILGVVVAVSGVVTGANTPGRIPRLRWKRTSFSQASNTSVIEITVESSPAPQYVTSGTFAGTLTVDGQNVSISGPVTSGKTNTIQVVTRTITHGADGTKTVALKLTGGIAGTGGWPTSYSMSGSAALDRIPKAPSAPGTPSMSSITASSAYATWTAPSNNNGSAVTDYRLRVSKNSNMSGYVEFGSGTGLAAWATGLDANTDYYAATIARNAAGWGAQSGVRAFRTSPTKPAALTGGSVARVSDAAQDLSWVRNPSAAGPYTTIEVGRRVTGDQTTRVIISLPGTATSYRDSSTVASKRYDYFARPVNAWGAGDWLSLGGVNTSPNPPIGVWAVKQDTGILIGWEPGTSQWGSHQFEIWDNPGGTGIVHVGTVAGNVLSWTHPSPDPSVTHRYSVGTAVYTYNGLPNLLYSVRSAPSAVVQLLAPPLAPTLVGPTGTLDRELSILFVWDHNPVDTTTQRAFNLRYRVNGGAWVNRTGTTSTSLLEPALSVVGTIEWQVQTRGQHATFGAWSAISTFKLASKPTVAISDPSAGDFAFSRVAAAWGYYQAEDVAQASYVARLLDAVGQVVETRQGTGVASSAVFASVLKDSTAYTLAVEVTAANGLKASTQISITTDFPLPVTVDVFPVFDPETGGVTFTFGELPIPGPGESIPDYLDVTRQIGDGPEVLIGTGYQPGDAGTDPLPDLVQVNKYRAISRTNLPTETVGQAAELVAPQRWPGPQFFVNGGPGFGMVCISRGSTTTDTPTVGVAHHQFVGDEFPTPFWDSHSTQTITFNGRLLEESTRWPGWHELLQQRSTVCIRDWLGRRVFGTLSFTLPHSDSFTTINGEVFRTQFREEEYWISQAQET